MNEDARDPATRDDDDLQPAPPTSEQLAWLRRRLALDDRLLGFHLNRYQEMEDLSDHQLAEFLGASVDQVNRMRLAGRPREDRYNADVRDIARINGVSDFQLIRLLRSVRFDEAVAAAPIAGRLLAAARDVDGEPSEPASPAVAEERAPYGETERTDHDGEGHDPDRPDRPDSPR